jgi:hypothetical protein
MRNIQKYILGIFILVVLIMIGFILRQDKVIKSATSDSGEKQAVLFQTNGLFGKKYCLRIITMKTGVSFVQDEPQMNTLREVDVTNTKLKWKSDIKLTIEFGNGLTQIILLNEVGQPRPKAQ